MTTTLACLSDLHAGSSVAGCPQPVALDDGGVYEPSVLQRWISGKMATFIDTIDNARRDRLGVLLNGDLVEGDHHGTAQLVSNHPHIEFAIIKDMLAPLVQLKPDFVVVTRGTAAHVGKSGNKDEAVGHYLHKDCGLKVVRTDTGKYSHYLAHLNLEGHLVWATHHGKVGSVDWSNVVANRALAIYLSCVKRGLRPPDIVIQAHNHRTDDSWWKHPTRVVQQAAWQYKTDHAYKVVPTDLTDLGGVIGQFTAGKRPEVEHHLYYPDEPEYWTDEPTRNPPRARARLATPGQRQNRPRMARGARRRPNHD